MLKKTILLIICIAIFISMFSGCSFSGGSSKPNDIYISEVVSSNAGSLQIAKLGSSDWVELCNPTAEAVNLEGYTLSRTDKANCEYTFSSVEIEAGGYLVCAAAASAGVEQFDIPCLGYKLPKEGTELLLKNADGRTLQKLKIPALNTDISYCYAEGGYKFCLTPTPNEENSGLFFDSLKEIYSKEAPEGLLINEASRDFIEVYNKSKSAIQLAYFTVSDDAADLSKYRFPYCELQPGEYFVVYFGDAGVPSAPFSISEEEGYIYLGYGEDVYDLVDVYDLWEGMSVGLNENGKTVYFAATTPGEKNGSVYSTTIEATDMAENAPVTVTEILLKNKNSLVDDNGDRSDWVEIHNNSDAPVSLKNYYLSDDENSIIKWQLPDTELGADDYMIIYLSGNDAERHTSFKVGEGEPLILTDYSTLSKQTVNVPDESRLKNISYGIQDGKWLYFGCPTPGRANTTHGSESITNVEKLDKSQAYINEISASFPPHSKGKDWIELYNPSDSSVSLDGLYLSNDMEQLELYALSGSIAANGYKVIYASKRTSKQGADTAPFSISQSGESIYLSDGVGILDSFETGALRNGVSSGRKAGDLSGDRYFFSTVTQGGQNSTPLSGSLNSPEFSEVGGVKDSPITLELSGEGTIYYTTDGSTPTTASTLYTGPLSISETTCISAICAEDGYISSDPVSSTYLYVEEHTVPVVCLTSSQSDFNSVYAVSTWSSNKANNVERYCYIEYYEADGTLGTTFPAGFRVSGNSTRSYSQKSLGLYLRGGYGQTSVVYPFFENYAITEFKSLALRNAGQNCQYSRLSDAFDGVLFSDLNIETAQSRFVVLYINGKYWGLYDLKENLNEDAFASQRGEDPDKMNVIRRNTVAIAGNNTQIKQIYEYAKSWNMADDEKYEKFCEYVDEDAWIDYIIARSYSGDGDMFNQKMWYTSDLSTRVRPIFYDCDFAFGGRGNTLCEFFTGEGFTTPDGSKTNMWIPTALKKNAGWCDKFVTRYAQVMKYYPEYSLELYDKMVEEAKPEMKRQIARWHTSGGSYSSWENYVKNQRSIIKDRPAIIVKQIQSEFNVSTERMKELFPDFY